MLTYGISPEFRGGVHLLYLFKTAIRHRVSSEFIGSRNCVPMAFTAESPPMYKWVLNPYKYLCSYQVLLNIYLKGL